MAEQIYFTPKQKAPPSDGPSLSRAQLHEQLCQMTPSQFNWVIFYLRIPKISIPSPIETQATRAEAILRFVEKPGGIGLENLAKAIQKSSPKGGEGASLDDPGTEGKSKLTPIIASLAVVGALIFAVVTLLNKKEEPTHAATADTLNQAPTTATATSAPEAPTSSAVAVAPSPTPSSTAPAAPLAQVEEPAPPKAPTSLKPGTVLLFEAGSDVFYPEYFSVLDEVALALEQDKEMTLRLEGHTDSDGATTKNFGLSKRRADAVKSYFVARGIDASRLQTSGCGVVLPVASNDTEEGRKQNRRVEFVDLRTKTKPCAPR